MAKHAARLLFVIFTLSPLWAHAQTWLPGRESRKGPGIRLGDSLILHPGAVVEGGWDTNPIRESGGRDGAGRLRLSAYADLGTSKAERGVVDEDAMEQPAPKIDFRLGVAGYYDFFFSKDETVKDQRDFGIDSFLNFVLFPEGPYRMLFNAVYRRSIEPYESKAEMHARNLIKPEIGFTAQPGGGLLTISLKYGASVLLYEDPIIVGTRNKVTNDVNAEVAWKMFPKTAAVSQVRFSPIFYLGDDSLNNNSMPLRALCGIRGLLTNRFGLSLFVGYGGSFYEQGDDFDGPIASLEVMFFVTPFANIRVGGQRDFVDSFYSNFYVKNGGYVKYEQMFGRLFMLKLEANAFYRKYSTMYGNFLGFYQAEKRREETWLGTTLTLEYRATDWMSIIASAVYKGNISDFTYATGIETGFHEFEGLLGVHFHY